MDASSPAKRRVLGELDPNASTSSMPSPKQRSANMQQTAKMVRQLASPFKVQSAKTERSDLSWPIKAHESWSESARKRTLNDGDQESPQKRACLDQVVERSAENSTDEDTTDENSDAENRERSPSPAESSMFDNSAIDTSQMTAVTEPELDRTPVAQPVPMRPPRRLTPQEAKEKAEILRLRLGLANYKVRTGQTDVPLDELQARPVCHSGVRLLGGASGRVSAVPLNLVRGIADARSELMNRPNRSTRPPPEAALREVAQKIMQDDEGESTEDDDSMDKNELPPLPSKPPQRRPSAAVMPATPTTPNKQRRTEDDERLSSSALRGGAASGLLSLSRS